ncbi:GAF domain-containing sensor histidine kinase [Steroidobacter sp. S1-65]|uniref:Oxygen sensor histidine kinase NreB n=2 Tax=Steroidobacter gossypii TaxID=2805490 RepID=A0ABS1WQZ2_9GAMM|nr:GAF domain-containing sensor histidine kinase [Steroidobacter gossypii]
MSSGIPRFEGLDMPAMSEPFNTILEEIASELELRPLLTSIITRACGLLGAGGGTIGLYVPRRHTVQVEAIHQLPLSELGLEFEPGEGLIGKVLATGRPIIADHYGEMSRISLPELRDYAVIGVPIHGPGGGLLGVFGLGAPPPRKFGASDLETLRVFARHAAIAIQNAMRYEREKRRTERMTLIAHIARVITTGLEANELVATAAQVIHEHLGYPNVVIPLLYRDEDQEYLLFDGHAGNYGDVMDLCHRMPVTRGITGAAVLTRSPQIVNDVRKDPRYVPPPIPINVRTELAMPIVLGEEVFGCINIEGLEPFDEDDVASIQIIADHLAVAVKNASLSREARQAAVMRERQRLARDLHDAVSQALSSISLMSQSIVPAWRRDPAEGERRARRIEELARLAFAEMRALLRELRPDPSGLNMVENAGVGDVRRMGLAAALQRFAFILAPQTPSIRLDFAAYRSQSPSLEERLYLICREALSNAIRHSGADRLDVSAAVNDDVLMLSIQDNGRGFDVAARAEVPRDTPEQGIGLQTMSERAAALGGVCEVQSQPGRGTNVCIRIPLLAMTP